MLSGWMSVKVLRWSVVERKLPLDGSARTDNPAIKKALNRRIFPFKKCMNTSVSFLRGFNLSR